MIIEKNLIITIIGSLIILLTPGLWGMLGASAFYIHQMILHPGTFVFTTFLMYCFLGFVMSLMVHYMTMDTIGHSFPGLLMASGFSVRKIGDVAESYLKLGLNRMKK